MNYTIRQLQVFKAVADQKSFTKASEVLHLTQPAISIQFKSFTEQFDYPLIEFQGRELILTEFGHHVLREVNGIWDKLEALGSINQSTFEDLNGTLKVASVSTGKYIMPYFLTNFLQSNPGVNLSMDVTNKRSVTQSLDENLIDFALVSTLPDRLDCLEEVLMENELVLVGNAEKAQEITLENLPAQKFLLRETGSATRQAMEQFLKKSKLKSNNKITLTSNEAVKQSVLAGLGISVMPLIGIRSELEQGRLKIIPHDQLPIKSSWRLIWRSDKAFSPVAKAFIDHIRAEKQNIMDTYFVD